MDRTCRSVFERTDMQTIELDREDAPVYTCEVKKVDTEVVNEAEAVLVVDVDAADLGLGRVRGSTEDLGEILVMQTAEEAPLVADTTQDDWENLGLPQRIWDETWNYTG